MDLTAIHNPYVYNMLLCEEKYANEDKALYLFLSLPTQTCL